MRQECKPQPNIRIARSLVYLFPLKLIGADHGLHTSGGVQIFCFSEKLTLVGLGGLVATLKFGSEMESTLHYANSNDDPRRRSLHSIVFR